jgi:hypothetical protein
MSAVYHARARSVNGKEKRPVSALGGDAPFSLLISYF